MTKENAKKRLEVWLKCMDCPEDKQCYDSHLHSTCEYTDYCDETPISEAVKVAIKALEQEPCEDAISRAELLKAIDTWDKFGFEHTGCFVREPKDDFITYVHYDDVIKCIKGMPLVNPQPIICEEREKGECPYYAG